MNNMSKNANGITRRDLINRFLAFAGLSIAGCLGAAYSGTAIAKVPDTAHPAANYERVKIAYTQCIYRMDHPDPSLRGSSYEAYPVYKELAFPNGYTVTKTYTETQDDSLHMTFRRWTLTYHIY